MNDMKQKCHSTDVSTIISSKNPFKSTSYILAPKYTFFFLVFVLANCMPESRSSVNTTNKLFI